MIDVSTEFRQYVETALWSSTDESTPEGGEPMDRNYSVEDLAPEALASMRADLDAFLTGADAAALDFWQAEHGSGAIGHDFWLTRNRHGAGFWDRWAGGTRGYVHGRTLTDAARPYGTSDLYIGDDGKVYVS
jgi:hypothetical protein